MTDPRRHLALAGSWNIRDLGGYATPAGPTQWRRLLRADGLHGLAPAGRAALVDEGLRLVIDLRRDEELAQAPNPFAPNAFATEPRVGYRHVSLFDGLAPAGFSHDTRLRDLYLAALAQRGTAFAEVITAIAEAPPGLVLFHCTAGKDRTGLIAALLLALAGVSRADILADYALTGDYLAPAIPGFLAAAEARGLPASELAPLLASDPANLEAALAAMEAEAGSIGGWLAAQGLAPRAAEAAVARLLG